MSDVVQSGICPSRGMLNMHCMSGVGVGALAGVSELMGRGGPTFTTSTPLKIVLGCGLQGTNRDKKE